jgi:misacylated tRNA(Ala) deacylase
MTTLLYQTDSALREFTAQVTAVNEEQHGVVLDQTAFYPGGGGQPYDVGQLYVGDTRYDVTKMERGYVHVLGGDALPQVGDIVRGVIDWERRYALMRTHTAMHILCGVVWRDYGASVTGGNMEPLEGRMDFEFERLQKELVGEIEAKINAEIAAARDIRVQILPREEVPNP